jgi:hypothetical protein
LINQKQTAIENFTRHYYDCRQYEELRSLESIVGNARTTTLAKWIQKAIVAYQNAHHDMNIDNHLLSIPPTSIVKSYKAMKAYGYYYRVLDEPNLEGYVTNDCGLISIAEQMVGGKSGWSIEMGYAGELVANYEIKYDGILEPIILMKE